MRPYWQAVDSLMQLVTPTMDGDIIDKEVRKHYIDRGWAKRELCKDGFARTSLTATGHIALHMIRHGHSVSVN